MNKLSFLSLLLTAFLFISCNSNDTSITTQTTSESQTSYTAQVIDAPVSGLHYECGSFYGTTDTNGTFHCETLPVTFKVGDLTLATLQDIPDDNRIYPQDLVGTTREDITSPAVIEMARLLQSLDDDGNISSSISITPDTAKKFTTSQDYQQLSSLEKARLFAQKGLPFKPATAVIAHLKDSLGIDAPLLDAIEHAEESKVSLESLYAGIEQNIDDAYNQCVITTEFFYPDGFDSANFSWISDYFTSSNPRNIPFHAANVDGKIRVYSYVGEDSNTTRYSVLSTNIFRFDTNDTTYSNVTFTDDINQKMFHSTTQLLKWLLKKESDAKIFDQNITIVVNSSYMQISVEQWLEDNNVEAPNWIVTTDETLIESGAFDLYIAESNGGSKYKEVLAQQKPVIVFENGIYPDDELLAYFGIKWAWYGGTTINNFASSEEFCTLTLPLKTILTSIENLKNNTLHFQYNDTACPTYVGKTTCDPTLLLNENNKTMAEEFANGASAIQNALVQLDAEAKPLFSLDSSYDTYKMVVLLADKYRKEISYPMDKELTDDTTFYKAYFSDHAISYTRANNPSATTLGDFTLDIPATQAAPRDDATFSFTPTSYNEWSTTGLYAVPGETLTITRTDTTATKVQVRFNMLRVDTTRMWDPNGYTRPRFIASNPVTVEPGKSVTLSSPIGGPIYVYWEGVAPEDAQEVTLEFTNVAKHPTLFAFDDASIDTFIDAVATTPFDWIDIKTPYVEIHSLKSKFNLSYIDSGYFPYQGDLQQYLADINQYLVINNLNLAGFKGDSLALSSEVQDWCEDYGLDCSSDIHIKPKIQHINADNRANCGDGCSGNPFDVDWPVTPTGWGESHEYGHNLQRSRLKIYESRSTEVSNNIFPLHTNTLYLQDHNISVHPNITSPDNAGAYLILQEAIQEGITPSIQHPMWVDDGTYANAGERLSFYNQLVFINSSWDIFTKLYLVERLFNAALENDDSWDNAKSTLGFGNYTRDEAIAINGNDFMAITLSKFTDKDYRDYMYAWGIDISDKASTQINDNGFSTTVPLEFYLLKENKLTKTFPTKTLPLDGIIPKETTLYGICSDTATLSKCAKVNTLISYDTPDSGSIYFTSVWSENGPTTATTSGDEGYTQLLVPAQDPQGNTITLKLKAAKTSSDDGVDGVLLQMNDDTEVSAVKTSLVVWLDPDDNDLDSNTIYHITEDIYINVYQDDTIIDRYKLLIEDIISPVTLTFDDTSSAIIRGYPELNDSSTFFVTTSLEQGPITGVWENTLEPTPVYVNVIDEDGNSAVMQLSVSRDAYKTDGSSSIHTIMNSGIIYGKDNALIIEYNSEDNPDLVSGKRYTATEFLVIDAKLWSDKSLREQLQVDIDVTIP